MQLVYDKKEDYHLSFELHKKFFWIIFCHAFSRYLPIFAEFTIHNEHLCINSWFLGEKGAKFFPGEADPPSPPPPGYGPGESWAKFVTAFPLTLLWVEFVFRSFHAAG